MSDATDFTATFNKVVRLLNPDAVPVLTKGDGTTIDLTRDVDAAIVNNRRATTWAAATVYVYGQTVLPTVRNGHRYRVTQGGTSGATEPTWPSDEYGTVTNGSSSPVLTFEEAGEEFGNIYDVRGALEELWTQRGGKAFSQNVYLRDGRSDGSDYTYLNCQREAAKYRPLEMA